MSKFASLKSWSTGSSAKDEGFSRSYMLKVHDNKQAFSREVLMFLVADGLTYQVTYEPSHFSVLSRPPKIEVKLQSGENMNKLAKRFGGEPTDVFQFQGSLDQFKSVLTGHADACLAATSGKNSPGSRLDDAWCKGIYYGSLVLELPRLIFREMGNEPVIPEDIAPPAYADACALDAVVDDGAMASEKEKDYLAPPADSASQGSRPQSRASPSRTEIGPRRVPETSSVQTSGKPGKSGVSSGFSYSHHSSSTLVSNPEPGVTYTRTTSTSLNFSTHSAQPSHQYGSSFGSFGRSPLGTSFGRAGRARFGPRQPTLGSHGSIFGHQQANFGHPQADFGHQPSMFGGPSTHFGARPSMFNGPNTHFGPGQSGRFPRVTNHGPGLVSKAPVLIAKAAKLAAGHSSLGQDLFDDIEAMAEGVFEDIAADAAGTGFTEYKESVLDQAGNVVEENVFSSGNNPAEGLFHSAQDGADTVTGRVEELEDEPEGAELEKVASQSSQSSGGSD